MITIKIEKLESGVFQAEAKIEDFGMTHTVKWDSSTVPRGPDRMMVQNALHMLVESSPPATAMKGTTQRGQRTVMEPNIQRYPRVSGDDREHNAAKPVALMGKFVTAATDAGESVLDLFGGSGSTLMACEALGRRCRIMEIEPKYAQIIVERWQRKTGRKAERESK